MEKVRQIFLKIGAVIFIAFFSITVFGQWAIRLVIPIVSNACFNGADDDSDWLVDYPDDTDCIDQDDLSEHHLTATCSVSATTVTLGQPVTWSVTPLWGSTTYSYSWTGTELTSNIQDAIVTYSSAGNKTASVTVTAGHDSLLVNCTDTVTVTSADGGNSSDQQSSSGGNRWPNRYFESIIPVVPPQSPSEPVLSPTADTPYIPEEDVSGIDTWAGRDPVIFNSAPEISPLEHHEIVVPHPIEEETKSDISTQDNKHDDMATIHPSAQFFSESTEYSQYAIIVLVFLLFISLFIVRQFHKK